MRITYDPDADVLAILLLEDRESADATDIAEGVTAWLDRDAHIIGLEVLDAKERLGGDPLDCISIERLTGGLCSADSFPSEAGSS